MLFSHTKDNAIRHQAAHEVHNSDPCPRGEKEPVFQRDVGEGTKAVVVVNASRSSGDRSHCEGGCCHRRPWGARRGSGPALWGHLQQVTARFSASGKEEKQHPSEGCWSRKRSCACTHTHAHAHTCLHQSIQCAAPNAFTQWSLLLS